MSFTGNSRGVRLAILILVVLFVVGGAGFCAKQADAAENKTIVAFGVPFIGGDRCEFQSMTISREIDDGAWLAGLVTHGTGECRGEAVAAQIGAMILHQTYIGAGRMFSIGFGAAMFEHGDIAVGPHSVLDAAQAPRTSEGLQGSGVILVRAYLLSRRLVVDMPLHFSTGKATYFNPGRNLIQVGYRFGQ